MQSGLLPGQFPAWLPGQPLWGALGTSGCWVIPTEGDGSWVSIGSPSLLGC